jgi:hypothetical protein
MEEAMHLFSGSTEQPRIVLANAELAIERGEIDPAISILAVIGPSQS